MFILIAVIFIAVLGTILVIVYRQEKLILKTLIPQARIEEYWTGRERRKHFRFQEQLEVTYTIEKKSHLKNGKTVDISHGGMKLLLDEKLATGTIVDLKITLPRSTKVAEVEGETVWSEEVKEPDPSGRRLFCSGIKFIALKEPSGKHLIDYIYALASEIEIT